MVSNIGEIIDMENDMEESDLTTGDRDEMKHEKGIVLKTSMRYTIFLPVSGLVPISQLKVGDLVGANKSNFLILEKLPSEYDSRVSAFELTEKPQDEWNDIGGLDKAQMELKEAIVMPMTHADKFEKLGIEAPKGVLLWGPPGTGKTMMARCCARETNATFLKLAGPSLVQMQIGEGAKMVRDAFQLARDKAPSIIFIDEIDAIGVKRSSDGGNGDREVQRTMLELLNQLDGFSKDKLVKVIAATNRPDILDPALVRSGRIDRKVELPHPDEDSRRRIMQIHSRQISQDKNSVNFQELARSTEDFNGAQLKSVCVEAGMCALRRDDTIVLHRDQEDGIMVVKAKKKANLFQQC